ncbi:WbqC family protein [Elusimicrobiota bacterium]
MILGIHQPQYMPWLGYFDKIFKSDRFIFLDDVQYKKREYINRNKIKTPQGSMWLTVPVLVKGKYEQKINEVAVNNTIGWQNEHIKAIEHSYGNTPFFKEYFPLFEEVIRKDREYLWELNMEVIKVMLQIFQIEVPYSISSEMGVETEKTQRLIDLCKESGADEYLSGQGAKDYMEEEMFKDQGIKLNFQEFSSVEYDQNFGDFIPNLSAIDYIFNCGSGLFSKKKEE